MVQAPEVPLNPFGDHGGVGNQVLLHIRPCGNVWERRGKVWDRLERLASLERISEEKKPSGFNIACALQARLKKMKGLPQAVLSEYHFFAHGYGNCENAQDNLSTRGKQQAARIAPRERATVIPPNGHINFGDGENGPTDRRARSRTVRPHNSRKNGRKWSG